MRKCKMSEVPDRVKKLPWILSLDNNGKHCLNTLEERNNGYFFKTTIKKSTIDAAGNGRFTLENIASGTMISKRKCIHPDDDIFDPTKIIAMLNVNDVNKLIERYILECDKPASVNTIVEGLANFSGCYDKQTVLLCCQSDFINHSLTHSNVRYAFENGYKVLYSTRAIEKHQELFLNYQKSEFPKFFDIFCEKSGVFHVHQFSTNSDPQAKSKL